MSMRLLSKAAAAVGGGTVPPPLSREGLRSGVSDDSVEALCETRPAPPQRTFYELVGDLTQEYDRVRDRLGEVCAENGRLRYHLDEAAASSRKGSKRSTGGREPSPPGRTSDCAKHQVAVPVDATRSRARARPAVLGQLVPEPEDPESPRSLPPDDHLFISSEEASDEMNVDPTSPARLSDASSGVRFSMDVTEERFDRETSPPEDPDGELPDRSSFTSTCSVSSAKSVTDQLMISSASNASFGGEEFELLPVWVKRSKKGSRKSAEQRGGPLSMVLALKSNYVSMAPDAEKCLLLRLMSYGVTRPSSRPAIAWDSLTVLVLLWDLVVIPLSAYELPESEVWAAMELVATVVWTIDIALSFFRGFEVAGDVELRPRRIMRHYMRTWFFFDISLVGVDWALFVVQSGDLVDFLRFSRFRRALRLLRLARLLKHGQRFLALVQSVQSEDWLVILRIVWLLVVLIAINHFISCAWYAVGNLGVYEESWVVKAFEQDSQTHGFGYRYMTSFHWSVTQFTPASMEVVPRNALERTFNIVMIFLGLLMFSSFISNMTNGMTYLTKRNYEKRQQRDALVSYMNAKGISLKLRHDIITFLGVKSAARRRALNESDIASFRTLPEALLEKLRIEVHAPVLQWHSLFSQLYTEERTVIYLLCHHALCDRTLTVSEDLFKFGVRCTRMYFLITGTAKYTVGYGEREEPPTDVHARQWISEPCLWFTWEHRGKLQAKQVCELSELNALEFQTLMTRSSSLVEVQRYAKLYAHHAERENGGAEHVTDIWGQRLRVMDLVQKSFRPDEADEDNPASKVMQLWRGNEIPIELVFHAWRVYSLREKRLRAPGLLNRLYRWYVNIAESRRVRALRRKCRDKSQRTFSSTTDLDALSSRGASKRSAASAGEAK